MISAHLGLTHVNVAEGENVTGIFVRSAHLASGKFAIVQNATEFTFVPWQPQMKRFRGKGDFVDGNKPRNQLRLERWAPERFASLSE